RRHTRSKRDWSSDVCSSDLRQRTETGMMTDWSQERILVFAPHPDDETLGCGGLMRKAKSAGAEVFVQFLTVGDTADQSPRGFSTAQERYTEIKRVSDHFRSEEHT